VAGPFVGEVAEGGDGGVELAEAAEGVGAGGEDFRDMVAALVFAENEEVVVSGGEGFVVVGDVLPCFDGGEGGFFGGGAGIEGSGEVIEEGRGFVPAVQQREGVGELEEAGGVVVRDFLEFGQFAFDAGDDGTGLEGKGFALGASGSELGVVGLPSGEGGGYVR
jgi:hypothetical protein